MSDNDRNNRDDLAKELRKAQTLPRKHASFFQWHKKEVMEIQLCAELVRHLQEVGECGFNPIEKGEDPPDCIVTQYGKSVAIEVTELVVRESIEQQIKNNSAYVIGPEWNSALLTEMLNEILRKKDNPTMKTALRDQYERYILLIHTDEPELNAEAFKQIFDPESLNNTSLIDEAYVVFSYDPRADEQPVVRFV